jgi:SAM-dependent methyltransferase
LSQYRKYAEFANANLLKPSSSFAETSLNRLHHWLCRSDRWRRTLEQRVPWALGSAGLGQDVLEIGPGPGLTTDLLRNTSQKLTALELDARLAGSLRERTQGTNVEVVTGDATDMPFPDARFSGAVAFTMLHHVYSASLQDRLLREVHRVVKPGGIFAGCDSRLSVFMRLIHIRDTYVPVHPESFGARLEAAGFDEILVEKNSRAFRFRARRSLTP